MLMVNKTYVTHYAPLEDRKAKLEKDLDALGVEAAWFEQEPTTGQLVAMHHNTERSWVTKTRDLDYGGPIPWKYLSKAEISLAFKHIRVLQDIVRNKVQTALVIEDDVVFDDDFVNKFNLNLMSTPKDWDMIFIGSGCDLRVPQYRIQEGTTAYLKAHPASKCTDSYLITYDSAERLCKTIIPFTMPIDFELNYQMKEHNMNVYWWDPPLIKQGSQCGLFESVIQT